MQNLATSDRPARGCWSSIGRLARGLVIVLAACYILGMLAWFGLYSLKGDQWWWLFFLNTVILYFFLPLPLVLVGALMLRHRGLLLGGGLLLALLLALYGPLFWPKRLPRASSAPQLTVMTYNVLVFNDETSAVIDALKSSQADVIALQELGPTLAAALRQELSARYPYQLLEPSAADHDVTGQGIISRLPMRPLQEHSFDRHWFRRPQLAALEFDGQQVTLVNFHAYPTIKPRADGSLNETLRLREGQARQLIAVLEQRPGPVIWLGDLNVSERSETYKIMASQATDLWRAAGWGFGHTWPGGSNKGQAAPPGMLGSLPHWLVRVDYLFCSAHWQPLRAEIGPWDGGSDHRPVRATLQLKRP